jgi:hypothetical protein
MLILQLDENNTITADPQQWILRVRHIGKNEKTGEPIEYFKNTYHATLSQAVKKYCDGQIHGCEDLKAVVSLVEALNAKIDALFTSVSRKAAMKVKNT